MLLDANIFQPLIDVFAAVLKFFHNDIGVSWGLSIILLTVAVRLLLVPLGMRQFHSMQRMALHMPEMKLIREKYKDNPQRQQQETMAFYKENNVNPFASCLPLLIQWPFLIGLFWTLRGNLRTDICPTIQDKWHHTYAAAHSIPLSKALGQTTDCNGMFGSHFFFIHDLTNSPHGLEVVILLILYIGTSIGSSMIMMMPGTEKNQRRMMLVLPVVFAFITIRFPAGALLYYIVFNLWMVIQQSVFKQLIGQQYRHPPGTAIGIAGVEGSVSSGGGLRGLFGFPKEVGSDDGAGSTPDPVPAPRSERPRGQRPSASRRGAGTSGSRATAEPKTSKPRASGKSSGSASAKASGKSANGASANGSSSGGTHQSAPPPSPRKKKKRSGRRR